LNSEMANTISAAGLKTAPPAVISTLAALGAIDMTFLVGAATFVYVVAQLAYLLWKWNRERKASKAFAEKIAAPLE
jgi:hypothetical protein